MKQNSLQAKVKFYPNSLIESSFHHTSVMIPHKSNDFSVYASQACPRSCNLLDASNIGMEKTLLSFDVTTKVFVKGNIPQFVFSNINMMLAFAIERGFKHCTGWWIKWRKMSTY